MFTTNFSLSQLDEIIAKHLFPSGVLPVVFYVQGPLGAGKTTLAQALARYLGIKQEVNSPTFNYVNVYPIDAHNRNNPGGVASFVHFDLYRLSTLAELVNLGLLDLLMTPAAVVFVEWPEVLLHEFAPTTFSKPVLQLVLAHQLADSTRRNLTFSKIVE